MSSVSATGSPSKRSTARRCPRLRLHVVDEGRERESQPLLVRLSERDDRAAAPLDEERGLAAEEHDVGAGDAGGPTARPLRPRQRRSVRLRWIRRGEQASASGSPHSDAARASRSTAPPSANWAPPRPSTK